MPSYRDNVWSELNSLDSNYTNRVGDKGFDGWVNQLSSDAKFTVNIYNYLKNNNSQLVKDVNTAEDFYKKFTEGLQGQSQLPTNRKDNWKDDPILSKAANVDSRFYSPLEFKLKKAKDEKDKFVNKYSPLLEGKTQGEINQAYLTKNIDGINLQTNVKPEDPAGSHREGDMVLRPRVKNTGGSLDQEYIRAKKTNPADIKSLTHTNLLTPNDVRMENMGIHVVKEDGRDPQVQAFWDKLHKLRESGNITQQEFDAIVKSNSSDFLVPDMAKVSAVSPFNKNYQATIIGNRTDQQYTFDQKDRTLKQKLTDSPGLDYIAQVARGWYMDTPTQSPYDPEVVNKWWNEKTMSDIGTSSIQGKVEPGFFEGTWKYGTEEANEEYAALWETLKESGSYWEQMQLYAKTNGKEGDIGFHNGEDTQPGQSEYNAALKEYAAAANNFMNFFFDKTKDGALVKAQVTAASVENTKIESDQKIASTVFKGDLNLKKDDKEFVFNVEDLKSEDTFYASMNQTFSTDHGVTVEAIKEMRTLNEEVFSLRNQYNEAVGKEDDSGAEVILKKLKTYVKKEKELIIKTLGPENIGKVALIIDPVTGKTIRNPNPNTLQPEALKAYNEVKGIKDQYSTGIFTNNTVRDILSNLQASMMYDIRQLSDMGPKAGTQWNGFWEEVMEQDFGFTSDNDSKLVWDDFKYFDKAVKRFEETGRMDFEELTPIPGGASIAVVQDYNAKLNKYRALSEVYLMNYDPILTLKNKKAKLEGNILTGDKTDQLGRLWDGIVEGTPEAVGMAYTSLSDEELQQEFVNSMIEDFNITQTEEVEEENEDGEMVKVQRNVLQNQLNRKLENVSMYNKIGRITPTFVVMAGEAAAITVLTRGMGAGAAIANIGTKVTRISNILFKATRIASKAPKFSRRMSTVMGGWTKMMAEEALILEGSNQIGGALWNRERMPVGTFAFGAVGMKMTMTMLGRYSKLFNASMLSKSTGRASTPAGRIWGTANSIMINNPKKIGALTYVPKKMLGAGIGTLTIKSGEFVGSLGELFSGEMTYNQFWDHALDADSFLETYGAMMVMGTRTGLKDGRLAFGHIKENVFNLTNNIGTRKFNIVGKQLGLPRLSNWSTKNFANGKSFWTEGQINEALSKRILEIEADPKLNEAQKKAAISEANQLAKFASLKAELDGFRATSDGVENTAFGEKSMNGTIDKILERISKGQNTNLGDQLAWGQIAGFEGSGGRNRLVKELMGAGMSEQSAIKYMEWCENLSKVNDAKGFKDGSKSQRDFFKTQAKGYELNGKEKSLKDAYKRNEITESTLKLELENIKAEQEILLEKEREIEKANEAEEAIDNQIAIDKITEAEIKEYKTTAEMKQSMKDLGQEFSTENETNYGAQIDIVDPKTGKMKPYVFVDKSKANTAKIEWEKEFERSKPMLAEGVNFKIMSDARKNTLFHEIIHPAVEQYVKGPEGRKFVESFIDVLKQTGEYKEVLEVLKNHPDYKRGYLGSEWLTIYGEMVRDGRLDPYIGKNKRAFKNFKSKLNEFMENKTPFKDTFFKDGVDVRDFLLQFGKAKGEDFAKISEVANEAIREYKDFINGEKTEFAAETRKASVDNGPKINKLYKENQKEWLNGGAQKAQNIMVKEGLLDNLIAAQLPYDRYKKGWTKELDREFVQSVYGEMTNHIKGFEKSKQTTSGAKGFFAWVNSYIYHKGLNIKKILEKKDVSLDALKEEAGFDPSDSSFENFGEKTVESTYKPLTSKQVLLKSKLKPETVTDLDKTFKDLDFNKLVEAFNTPAGKNQTISPFIREFKKDFGKKGQKAVAETMGKKKADYKRYIDNAFDGIIETLPVGYLSRNFPYLVEKSAQASSTGRDNRFTSGPKGVKLKSNITEADKAQFLKDAVPDRWQAKRDGLAYQIADSYGSKRFMEILDSKTEIDNKIDLAEAEFETSRNEFDSGIITKKEFDVRRDLYMSDIKKFMAEGNAIEGFDGAFKEGDVKDFKQKVNQQIEISNFRKNSALREAITTVVNEGLMPEGVNVLDISNSIYDRIIEKLSPRLSKEVRLGINKESKKAIAKMYKDFAKENTFEGGFGISNEVAGKMANEMIKTLDRVGKGFKYDKSNIILDGVESKKLKSEIDKEIADFEVSEALTEVQAISKEAAKLQAQLGISIKSAKELALLRAEEGQLRTIDYFERKIDNLEGDALKAEVERYLKYNTGHLITAGGEAGYRGQFFGAMPTLLERLKPILKEKNVDLTYKLEENGNLKRNSIELDGEKVNMSKSQQTGKSMSYIFDYIKEMEADAKWAENNPEKFEKLKLDVETRKIEADQSRDALIDEIVDDFIQFKEGKMDREMLFLKLNSYNTNMRTHLREAANLADVMIPFEGDVLTELTVEHKKAADPMLRRIVAEMQNKNNWNGLEFKEKSFEKVKEIFDEYETALVNESFDNVLAEQFKVESPREGLIFKEDARYARMFNRRTLGDGRSRAVLNLAKYIETKDFEASKEGKAHEIAAKMERGEEVTNYDRKVVEKISYLNKSSTKGKSKGELIDITKTADKALEEARRINPPVKKARVFDFDDTVARTKSKVFATKGGEKKTLTAEEFAKDGKDLVDAGWKMDFSDFNKVVDGKKGPLFDLMKKMKEAEGDRDMFILTARAAESAPAIHEFLKQMGIDIPLENIKGLGNSTGEAKAEWIVGKAAEGYNDFYFADDAMANVEAVKKALEPIDVKSQVQQARINKSSVELDKKFNQIIENKTGIGAEKEFSKAKAKVRGAEVSSYKLMGPSAQDFSGLMDYTLGKGKEGDAQREFYNETLYKPYNRAQRALSQDRVNLMQDFKKLKQELDVPKDLRENTKSGFTKEQAVRVNLYSKMGYEVPGLSKTDLAELNKIVENDPKLSTFANQILSITKGDGYAKPKEHWLSGTITTDFIDLLNTSKRGKYLTEWQANVDVMFSEKNMNKLEAAYGPKYREALSNSLARMKAGKNRIQSGNRLSDRALDYINNAQGTIMFLNMRSAILQTLSSANYTNTSFNNPLKMGKAFANQKQYWKDFVDIMNSDYLVDRRNGLKLNISESEIADAAATSGNKAKAAVNYILEKGYLPTKFADSFAIASGGSMWYRNRINDIMKKEGLSEAEAKTKAFGEFMELSEKSQQSSDPSKISQQQSGDMGRILLQFVNTPMQYNRLQLTEIKDIINKRGGNPLPKIGKILYYGAMQNLWFNFMQQAAFAIGFDDDLGDAEIEDKFLNTGNGMLDSVLRGTGFAGMTISVLKNTAIDAYKRIGRKQPDFQDAAWQLLGFSPAIKNKVSKLKNAAWQFDTKQRRQEMIDKGFSLDNPAFTAFAKVVSATTNVPLDRFLQKIENVQYAMSDESETWQKVATLLGWPEWQLKNEAQKTEDWQQEKEDYKYRQAQEDPTKYSKAEQVDILMQHGYSEEDIKKMKDSGTRAATIKAAEEKSGKIYTSKIKKPAKTDKKKVYSPYVKEEERTDISEADKKTNANVKKYFNYNKAEQVEKLDSLGFSKKVIREQYNTEQKRVDKLLRLIENDSIPARLKKSEAIPSSKRTEQQTRLYKLNKQSQVDTLKLLGLSDSLISTLKYEADRVKKIEELYKNKK